MYYWGESLKIEELPKKIYNSISVPKDFIHNLLKDGVDYRDKKLPLIVEDNVYKMNDFYIFKENIDSKKIGIYLIEDEWIYNAPTMFEEGSYNQKFEIAIMMPEEWKEEDRKMFGQDYIIKDISIEICEKLRDRIFKEWKVFKANLTGSVLNRNFNSGCEPLNFVLVNIGTYCEKK